MALAIRNALRITALVMKTKIGKTYLTGVDKMLRKFYCKLSQNLLPAVNISADMTSPGQGFLVPNYYYYR